MITLPDSDWTLYDRLAEIRYHYYTSRPQRDDWDRPNRREDNRIGVAAEAYVARLFGGEIYDQWLKDAEAFGTAGPPVADVGRAVEVKAISRPDRNLLLLHPADRDKFDRAYVLVYVARPKIKIVGWQHGSQILQPEYYADFRLRRPGWLYPKEKLNPFTTFPMEYVR